MVIPLLQQPFWFLRHGESQANFDDLIAGSTDTPLTDKGRAQAEAAAKLLADVPLASIWYSPLIRAHQTADAVAKLHPGIPMFPLPGLAERNWGGWEGQPNSILVREATPPGGGDSPEVFRARIRAALAQITGPFPTLIVAHSGTAREIHGLLSKTPFVRLDNARPGQWHQDGADGHWTYTPLS